MQSSSWFWQSPDCCQKRQFSPSPPTPASFLSVGNRYHQRALSQTGLIIQLKTNLAFRTGLGVSQTTLMIQLTRQFLELAQRKAEQPQCEARSQGKQGWGFHKQHSLRPVVTNDENVPQGMDEQQDSLANSWFTLDCYQTPPPVPCLMYGKLVPGAIVLWTKHCLFAWR